MSKKQSTSSGDGNKRADGPVVRSGIVGLYDRLYDFNLLLGERMGHGDRPDRYLGSLAASPSPLQRLPSDCALVSGSAGPVALAVERQVLRARGARMRRYRWASLAVIGVTVASFLLLSMYGLESIRGLFIVLLLASFSLWFGVSLVPLVMGGPGFMRRTLARWAQILGGETGRDDIDAVLRWADRNWRWAFPPSFLEGEHFRASGTRAGHAILIVVERQEMRWFRRLLMMSPRSTAAATGQTYELQIGLLGRLHIFIAGATLRTDAAAITRIRELDEQRYGVVPTGAGVYIHGHPHDRAVRPEYLLPILDSVIAITTAASRPQSVVEPQP